MNKRQEEYEKHAINLLRNSSEGVLSTISVRNEGYPFGSFVTYISDVDRSVVIYASNIAQHTINLQDNSKSCLTLFKIDDDLDKQNSSRMTLLGDLQSLPEKEIDETRTRFEEFLPESRKYASMHDFNFYRLHIDQIRWIGGFGTIAWVDHKEWKHCKPKWTSHQISIINHMNEDHAKNISASLNAQHGVQDAEAKMFALSIDGYFVKSKEKIYFISFEKVCKNAKEYKDILVEQANQYRSYKL